MKSTLLLALLVATTAQPIAASTLSAPHDNLAALRELAVRIKQDVDTLRRGEGVEAQQIDALGHALRNFEADAQADTASTFAQKYAAVARLLAEAEYRTQQAPARAAATASPPLDREVLAAQHGGACASALGVSTEAPVEIALGAAGERGDEAWFRIEARTATRYIVATDARGADPALEIRRDCAAAAEASNDDAVGLDAQVVARADAHAPLFVHVTNSGGGGAVVLSVTAADATIAGRVTDAGNGQGIPYPDLSFYSSAGGNIYVQAQTDSAGNYSATLPANQYYVRAGASQHVTELYPNAQCSLTGYYNSIEGCDQQHAQLVTATSGATTSGVNIALGNGQRIFGTVRDQNNQGVASAQLVLLDTQGRNLLNTQADQFGRYQIPTLPNGNYLLRATGSYYNSMYASQLYNHVTCAGPLLQQCDTSKATVLTIAGADLGGIDFNLQQLASIHGHVSGPAAQTSVYVTNAAGALVTQAYTDAQGNYSAGPLPVGQFYAYATSGGFFSQLYASVTCGQNCLSSLGSGTPIQITQQGQSPQIDFQLSPLPVQYGHVQDAVSGLPLAGVRVSASPLPPVNFNDVSDATTDVNGDYAMPAPQPGTYYLWARSLDHIDQLYSGIACEQPGGQYSYYNSNCDVTGATLVAITVSTVSLPDANFALQPSSSIAGHMRVRAGPGMDVPATNSVVQLYDVTGAQINSAYVDSLGNYVVSDLPPGTYFASANAQYSNYIGQVWQNIDCPYTCVPTQGTPIVVGASAAVTGIDFSVIRPDTIVGQVTDDNNAPLPGVLVDLFDANTLAYVATAATDANGSYLVSANIGVSYFVATEAVGGYIDQIYAGVSCPNGPAYQNQCPFAGATPVSLAYGTTQPHVVNFALSLPPDEIFSATFE